MFRLEG